MQKRIRQAAILFSAVILIGLLVLAVVNRARQQSTTDGPKPTAKQYSVNAGTIAAPAQPGTSIPHMPKAQVVHSASRLRKRGDHRVAARWMSPSQARKIKLPPGFHLAQIPWTGGLRHDTLPPNVTSRAPPLDRQRRAADLANASNARITFTSNFSCGTPVKVKRVSATHYILTFAGAEAQAVGDGRDHYWFLLRLAGVKGKTIRLDMSNVDIKYWQFLNPVYSYCHNLNNPKNFVSKAVTHGRAQFGYNGPILPDTSGQKWHFIVNVWREGKNLCLVQKFTHNHVYLAMHYPYTPKLNEAYMARLKGNPYCRVVNIGQSKDGRPLLAVEIPRPGNTPADKAKPCVLIYAREVADEQDGSWIAQGAINFLVSDSSQARKIRRRAQFIIVPMLDPDAAAGALHSGMGLSFVNGGSTAHAEEARDYAKFCQKWVNAGRNVAVVVAVDGSEPSGKPDFYCPLGYRGAGQALATHRLLRRIADRVHLMGLTSSGRAERDFRLPSLFAGWLNATFGSLFLSMDVNSQDVYAHLTIGGVLGLGSSLACGTARFLQGPSGGSWKQHIRRLLLQRARDWRAYGTALVGAPALTSEAAVRRKAREARAMRSARAGFVDLMNERLAGARSPGDPW